MQKLTVITSEEQRLLDGNRVDKENYATGQGIRQTITDDNLRAIAKEFGVTLNEEFLD